MKCKFVLDQCVAPRKERRCTPKASEAIAVDGLSHDEPPSIQLLSRIGDPSLAIGIDLESHDWLDGAPAKGRFGQFNWYTLKDKSEISHARIIQLGWAIGPTASLDPVEAKACYVNPYGDFAVSTKAVRFHNISQELLAEQGRPLKEVLLEFLEDVVAATERGGRVVAHHLEFTWGWLHTIDMHIDARF